VDGGLGERGAEEVVSLGRGECGEEIARVEGRLGDLGEGRVGNEALAGGGMNHLVAG